jgi:hypothetical protein
MTSDDYTVRKASAMGTDLRSGREFLVIVTEDAAFLLC